MGADVHALEMAAEIMFDIEIISRAKVVVGTLASQVTRLGCGLGVVWGSLESAVALDFELLQDQIQLHAQWGIRVDDVAWLPPRCWQPAGETRMACERKI